MRHIPQAYAWVALVTAGEAMDYSMLGANYSLGTKPYDSKVEVTGLFTPPDLSVGH